MANLNTFNQEKIEKEEIHSGQIRSMKLLLRHTSKYSSGLSVQLIDKMKSFHLANVEDFIPGIYVNQIL